MSADLFVGVTSWNSQLFLPSCLESIRATTVGIPIQLHVVDNCSDDRSAKIAKDYGAAVTVQSCTQQQALNTLIESAQCTYSLLIHADVVLLNPAWFALCKQKLNQHVVMVSPEDIGCGPLTRPFGVGKPESSFMLFKTDAMKRLRQLIWRYRFRLIWPRYEFDFSGNHLTHNIPKLLHSKSFEWFPMDVYISNRSDVPFYLPSSQPMIWSDELAYLRYGLGNFYGVDGEITHYHNWYDRVISAKDKPRAASQRKEFPPEFINGYSDRFLSDYKLNQVDYPSDLSTDRVPQAL